VTGALLGLLLGVGLLLVWRSGPRAPQRRDVGRQAPDRGPLVGRAREPLPQLVGLAPQLGADLLEARLHVRGLLLGGAGARLQLLDVRGFQARPPDLAVIAGLARGAHAALFVEVDAAAVAHADPLGLPLRIKLLRPLVLSRPLNHLFLLSPPVKKSHKSYQLPVFSF